MRNTIPPSQQPASPARPAPKPAWTRRLTLYAFSLAGLGIVGAACGAMLLAMALCLVYPKLPDVTALMDYRPKLPLRVYSAEGALLGEFGEERREFVPISEVPDIMINALLATEDRRFFQHYGVDPKGLARAALANLVDFKSQGASTITMQVARNVYLSSERTFTRKLFELALTFELEHTLSKQQIMEIYLNQIFLGQRAYGFAAAAETYFGKNLKDITIAEAAMLAGLPKAPSGNNPISNPKAARARQLLVIASMEDAGYITREQAQQAREEELPLPLRDAARAAAQPQPRNTRIHAEFVAEMVRQAIYEQYGDDTYTRGLNVYTTINATDQEAAYEALRSGIMAYEKRQFYRGPEGLVSLPSSEIETAVSKALASHPDNGSVLAAVVLEATPQKVTLMRPDGEQIEVTGDGLKPVQSGLAASAKPEIKIQRGAVVRVQQITAKGDQVAWELTQLPEVEGAFVAMDPRNGAIKALVGGFDFNKNKFNHVTQAWRQPGSSFKPFIYSASLEKGLTPGTIINDAPIYIDSSVTGGPPWEPRNFDLKFEGPTPLHIAMARSRNIPMVRVLQAIDPRYAQQWITRFGFDAEKHPPYLTMSLGAGAATPMQMATAYSVFANGGYHVNPWLITRITDQKGRLISDTPPPALQESQRAIPARNAFVMGELLKEVATSGTAARAQATLKRRDLYGKTGTTNNAMDTWFAGYQPTLTAVVWIGYDTPRNLGRRETGSGLSLPIWINFMAHALKDVPVTGAKIPAGVVNLDGHWTYEEFASPFAGVRALGMEDDFGELRPGTAIAPPDPLERQRIMDMFQN